MAELLIYCSQTCHLNWQSKSLTRCALASLTCLLTVVKVRAVAGIWRLQLPQVVKTQIAGKSLAGPEFETTLKLADDVFRSIQTPSVSATEAGANTSEVEALTSQRGGQARGRGQGARGQRGRGGRGRGAAATAKQPDQEKTEQEKPPSGCCRQHQRYGKKAFYCMLPTKCPWKQYINDPEQNK